MSKRASRERATRVEIQTTVPLPMRPSEEAVAAVANEFFPEDGEAPQLIREILTAAYAVDFSGTYEFICPTCNTVCDPPSSLWRDI